MSDINIDDLREQAELASSHPRERVELTGVEVLVLLDQLAAAEHRADEAEARIKAVEDVLAHHPYGGPDQEAAIRRALDGEQ